MFEGTDFAHPLRHSPTAILHAGLKNAPTTKQLEQCLDDMNAGRPQCPVGLHTLVMPSRKNSTKVDPEAQPFVYLNCGHVQGRHAWGAANESGKRTCPICLGETDTVQLKMGSEAGDVSTHLLWRQSICTMPGYMSTRCGTFWAIWSGRLNDPLTTVLLLISIGRSARGLLLCSLLRRLSAAGLLLRPVWPHGLGEDRQVLGRRTYPLRDFGVPG